MCFRLLTLWFDYGQWPEVHEALIDGIKAIKIDNWLQVKLLVFLCSFMPRLHLYQTFVLDNVEVVTTYPSIKIRLEMLQLPVTDTYSLFFYM